MSVAEALGGGLNTQHLLPVRTHPDKDRKGQRDGDKSHQGQIEQAHLMQKIEIRHRTDGEHVVAARDPLDKSVLIVEGDDIPGAQMLHRVFRELEFADGLDMQIEREIEVQLFERFAPVARRDLPQLAAHQIQRTFHQVVQRLTPCAFGGEFVHQAHHHGHDQEADEQQEVKLHKQLFH